MNEQRLQSIGRSIADELDASLSSQPLVDVAARLLETAACKRTRSTPMLGWAVAALATMLVGGVAAVAFWPRPHPLKFAVKWPDSASMHSGNGAAWVSAPDTSAIPVDFSDGTHVMVAPGARMRIARADTESVAIMVERGQLGFSVVHHEGTRWNIATGPFDVAITGTEFDLKWQPEVETLEVAVRRGSVVVTGCQFVHGKDLRTNEVLKARCGDTLSVTTTERAQSEAPLASTSPSVATEQEPVKDGAERPPREAVSDAQGIAPPKWQTLAQKGQYRAAYEIVERVGFDATCARASAADLSLLMDVERYAGQSARAESAARLLRSRFAGRPQAALAAFTLGRLAFDQAQNYASAAQWFRTYLKEQPGGALAREAEGRLMECLSRAGQAEDAKQVAQRYLSRYPEGPHARLARTLLGSDR